MIIDIEPTLKPASPIEKTILELRGIDALYVILTADGNEESVRFDRKSLDEFCHSKTVSEVLSSLEEGIDSQIQKFRTALDTNIHPHWTDTKKKMDIHPTLGERWTGGYYEAPLEMTKSQRKFFESEVLRLKAKSGKTSFAKISF